MSQQYTAQTYSWRVGIFSSGTGIRQPGVEGIERGCTGGRGGPRCGDAVYKQRGPSQSWIETVQNCKQA